jgi:predicted GNAT family acetyltransferase
VTEAPQEKVEVRHEPDQLRYAIVVDGVEAGHAEYEDKGDRWVFTHTRVLPEYEGRGLATRLIREALDDVRVHDGRIVALCPFVRRFLIDNPGYQDLVKA